MPITPDIALAAERLRQGGLVAFPTETVYGLGAAAAIPEAVRHIFAVKGRPANHPLIVHIGESGMMSAWARDIPPAAVRLAERFWPGPLTLILRRGQAPLEVTGGQDSVGLRVPDHPVALSLLRTFGGGVAAPSANRFGRVSPTRAEHVLDEFGDTIDLVLAGGDCRVGLESTILSLVSEQPVLLRPGAISATELEAVLGTPLAGQQTHTDIRAPGMLESHYAPDTRLQLCHLKQLATTQQALAQRGLSIAVMGRAVSPDDLPAEAHLLRMPIEAAEYGRQLYASLRQLDEAGFDIILVEQPPAGEAWRAINDRLGRACHPSGH